MVYNKASHTLLGYFGKCGPTSLLLSLMRYEMNCRKRWNEISYMRSSLKSVAESECLTTYTALLQFSSKMVKNGLSPVDKISSKGAEFS